MSEMSKADFARMVQAARVRGVRMIALWRILGLRSRAMMYRMLDGSRPIRPVEVAGLEAGFKSIGIKRNG